MAAQALQEWLISAISALALVELDRAQLEARADLATGRTAESFAPSPPYDGAAGLIGQISTGQNSL